MRHGRRRGRLGLVQEHRTALLRNLARNLITHQQIVTTHLKAKEAGRFVERLVTIAKQNTLHARRHLIQKLGSGSEVFAKRLLETIAPKFSDRNGGYTRVLHYKTRVGDGASMALLEFTVPVVDIPERKPKKKKEQKPTLKEAVKEKKEKEVEKSKHPEPKEEKKEVKKEVKKKEDLLKEEPKKGGFLGSLRRFLKGDDDKK